MLSKRLKDVANYIEMEDRLVDVGCDHGLLAIYLYQNNLCELVIASDKNQNALNNAIDNIKKQGLSNKIPTVISDGINDIDILKYEINTLILAGMGTHTILKILDNPQINNINKLIIQTNKEYYELRKEVTQTGFYIADETITLDNNKYYLTLCFKRGSKKYKSYNYQWGIIKKSNKKYYKFLLDKYEIIYKKIPLKRIVIRYKTKKIIKELIKIIKDI